MDIDSEGVTNVGLEMLHVHKIATLLESAIVLGQ